MSVAIRLYVTEKTAQADENQRQLTVVHQDVLGALREVGVEEPEKNLPSHGRVLQFTLANGDVLTQTDTHGIWAGTNDNESFVKAFDACAAEPGKRFRIQVESVGMVAEVGASNGPVEDLTL